jgi:hypothetical protein
MDIKKVSYSNANEENVSRYVEFIVEKILLERLSATEQQKKELIVSKYQRDY